MTTSTNHRDLVYDREAAYFDHNSLENRKDLEFLYGGFGIALAFEQLYRFVGKVQGKHILDYGCGNGYSLATLANRGASVLGIELSKQSVARANQFLAEQKVSGQALALPMNAERLGFEDGSFDVVMGTAILHHLDLDLELALPEIYRVLKPGGLGAFLEAQGKNFFVNLYRRLTPSKRTPDEHPLTELDFQLLEANFEQVDTVNFYLLALFSFLLRRFWRNEAVFITLNRILTRVDRKLMELFPYLERFCWIAVIQVKKTEKENHEGRTAA